MFSIRTYRKFFISKNHPYLIQIFSELVKREPSARLLLVGEGYNLKKIERKVAELGLEEKVIF